MNNYEVFTDKMNLVHASFPSVNTGRETHALLRDFTLQLKPRLYFLNILILIFNFNLSELSNSQTISKSPPFLNLKILLIFDISNI